jgi:hypothetical protein
MLVGRLAGSAAASFLLLHPGHKSISSSLANRVVIFDFLAKMLKILFQQFGKRLGNFWQLGKNQPPARKYTRAACGWDRGF